MPEKLTLKEMAKLYRCSEKTFAKYVERYNIPFEPLGNSKRFNPAKVEKHLEKMSAPKPEVQLTRKATSKFQGDRVSPNRERYAKLIGLA